MFCSTTMILQLYVHTQITMWVCKFLFTHINNHHLGDHSTLHLMVPKELMNYDHTAHCMMGSNYFLPFHLETFVPSVAWIHILLFFEFHLLFFKVNEYLVTISQSHLSLSLLLLSYTLPLLLFLFFPFIPALFFTISSASVPLTEPSLWCATERSSTAFPISIPLPLYICYITVRFYGLQCF